MLKFFCDLLQIPFIMLMRGLKRLMPKRRKEYLALIKSIYDRRLHADSSNPKSFENSRPNLYRLDGMDHIHSKTSVEFKGDVFKNFPLWGPLEKLKFIDCVFDQIIFSQMPGAILIINCNFSRCLFIRCSFIEADLKEIRFVACCFRDCDFDTRSVLAGVYFDRCRGLDEIRGLGSVQIIEPQGQNLTIWPPIQSTPLAWTEQFFSWERLRTIGRIPLFGISISALLAVPLLTWGIRLYNHQVFQFHRLTLSRLEDLPGITVLAKVAGLVHPILLPQQMFWTVVATLLLGFGSTLFTFGCPSRVKEFTSDRWIDELRQHPVRYLPLSWENRSLRLIAAICYMSGALIAILIIGRKLFNVVWYILWNTEHPWYGW